MLDWAAHGIPAINTARRGEAGKAMRLPRPALLCNDGLRLKEYAEQRNETGRIGAHLNHLQTCYLCKQGLNVPEIVRALSEMMKA